jgi:cysteinyl-tRNA synthetase
MLKIYNTLSKEKEVLKPLSPGKIGLYVCGITVYDYCHIGHARSFLVFDMVVRYLRYRGYDVKYIRNITDIDDKIIKRAEENNEPIEFLTNRFIQAMHEDMRALNLLQPTLEPRATEYIGQMIEMIQTLIEKGYAYIGTNGDVYYEVHKLKSYGCLSHRDLEDLQAGSRVDINEAKRNPLDFVLWKMAKPGEPHWSSPWGEGRPGWHSECSVMSLQNLGETFDIHGGGLDLKFPHHENERAQSEVVTGKKFVNIWMHAGFVQQSKEKMSKSLGNFLTIRDFLTENDPEVLRYLALGSHYRSPVEYSAENIESCIKALERFYTTLRGLPNFESIAAPKNSEFEQRFCMAMDDDFNTPEAIAVLFDLVREINRLREAHPQEIGPLVVLLKKLTQVLGLLNNDPDTFLQGEKTSSLEAEEIEALIEQRNLARNNKDWAEADKIRLELTNRGITLEDTAGKTLWRRQT